MAVRPTMDYLITFVRELINDPAGASQQYTDQQIQDRLDLNRMDVYIEDLREADTLTTAGRIEWHDFYSKLPFWEEDAVIQEINGVTLTPDDSNFLLGRWHFNAHQPFPIVITGKVYDMYTVAADFLLISISTLRNAFNWTADGTTVQRISQVKDLQSQAAEFRSKGWSWAKQIKLVRKDLRN